MNSLWSRWERNWLAAAGTTLTASAAQADGPVGNLVDPALARPWRIPAVMATLDADCGRLRGFRLFGLFGLRNASAGLRLRIRLSTVAAGGSDVWDSGLLDAGVERGFDQWVHAEATTRQARWLRLEIDDTGAADDYLVVGLGWAGDAFETAMPPDRGLTFGHDDPSLEQRTPGGQVYEETRRLVRLAAGAYSSLPRAQALAEVTDLVRSGSAETCLFVADPTGPLANRKTVAGLLRKSTQLVRGDRDDTDRYRFEFEIRERL